MAESEDGEGVPFAVGVGVGVLGAGGDDGTVSHRVDDFDGLGELPRGGGGSVYGSGPKGVYRRKTVPVGSFAPNGFGLHDMHGNVWEWVEDCWNVRYAVAPADGSPRESGECGRRILRGGSWGGKPRNLRSAVRFGVETGGRSSSVGFRVARTLAP